MRTLSVLLVSLALAGCGLLPKPEAKVEVHMPKVPPSPNAVLTPAPAPQKELCPPRPFTHSCTDRWDKPYPETIQGIDKADPWAQHMIGEAIKHRADPEKGEKAILDAIQAIRDVYSSPYERVNEAYRCVEMVKDGWESSFNRCVHGTETDE